MADMHDLAVRGLRPIPRTADHLLLLGAAVYSWLRPFPALIYIHTEAEKPPSGFVNSLAHAITEIAGRSSHSGDRVISYRRGEAYGGPQPYLITGLHPSEPATSQSGRVFRRAVEAMTASQSSPLVPDDERIRLVMLTGDGPLPEDLRDQFIAVRATEVGFPRWASLDAGHEARVELSGELERWIEDRRDSEQFQAWLDERPSPADAASIGQEILRQFLGGAGLSILPEAHERTQSLRAALARVPRRRAYVSDPALVTALRDVMRDALATRRARMIPGSSGEVYLGRVVGDRLHVIPSAARSLMFITGKPMPSALAFGRSLGDAGWITRGPDGAWTVPRRIGGNLVRVWDLPAEFLGEMVDHIVEEDYGDPARDLAARIRQTVLTAIADGRAGLAPAEGVLVDLGRHKSGRLYIIPSAVRELLTRADVIASPVEISSALGEAGWLAPAPDGAWTVPRRIDGKPMRVWNLPPSFLGQSGSISEASDGSTRVV